MIKTYPIKFEVKKKTNKTKLFKVDLVQFSQISFDQT